MQYVHDILGYLLCKKPTDTVYSFSMHNVYPRTALITGASSGIGLALAHEFAKHGHHVVLVARSRDALETLAQELREQYKIIATPTFKDLSQPNAAQELFDDLRDAGLTIDILVNNAGLGSAGDFVHMETNAIHSMLAVNMNALTELTRLFLPSMVQRHWGRILNVGSTAAYQPGPFMAVYYATKAYVLSFSEALSYELKGTGVSVTCLNPGATQTNFFQAGNMSDIPMARNLRMPVSRVAQLGYRGLMSGKRVVVPGFWNTLGTMVVPLLPRSLVLRGVALLQRNRR